MEMPCDELKVTTLQYTKKKNYCYIPVYDCVFIFIRYFLFTIPMNTSHDHLLNTLSHRECSHDDKLGMLAFLLAEEVDVVIESPHRWHFQA